MVRSKRDMRVSATGATTDKVCRARSMVSGEEDGSIEKLSSIAGENGCAANDGAVPCAALMLVANPVALTNKLKEMSKQRTNGTGN